MEFKYEDGGRSKYFNASSVGDCVTRAICNATQKDYKEVYSELQRLEKTLKVGKREKLGSARNGIRKKVSRYYIEKELGWIRVKTCMPGSHERVHLVEGEIPTKGSFIVQLSKHLTCLRDGVIVDTYDCSDKTYYDENGDLQHNTNRVIYGYWRKPSEEDIKAEQHEKALLESRKQSLDIVSNKLKDSIKSIDLKYDKDLNKLEKQIKKLQHDYKIMSNRKSRELKKVKDIYQIKS